MSRDQKSASQLHLESLQKQQDLLKEWLGGGKNTAQVDLEKVTNLMKDFHQMERKELHEKQIQEGKLRGRAYNLQQRYFVADKDDPKKSALQEDANKASEKYNKSSEKKGHDKEINKLQESQKKDLDKFENAINGTTSMFKDKRQVAEKLLEEIQAKEQEVREKLSRENQQDRAARVDRAPGRPSSQNLHNGPATSQQQYQQTFPQSGQKVPVPQALHNSMDGSQHFAATTPRFEPPTKDSLAASMTYMRTLQNNVPPHVTPAEMKHFGERMNELNTLHDKVQKGNVPPTTPDQQRDFSTYCVKAWEAEVSSHRKWGEYYTEMAKHQPQNASYWNDMANVAKSHAAEAQKHQIINEKILQNIEGPSVSNSQTIGVASEQRDIQQSGQRTQFPETPKPELRAYQQPLQPQQQVYQQGYQQRSQQQQQYNAEAQQPRQFQESFRPETPGLESRPFRPNPEELRSRSETINSAYQDKEESAYSGLNPRGSSNQPLSPGVEGYSSLNRDKQENVYDTVRPSKHNIQSQPSRENLQVNPVYDSGPSRSDSMRSVPEARQEAGSPPSQYSQPTRQQDAEHDYEELGTVNVPPAGWKPVSKNEYETMTAPTSQPQQEAQGVYEKLDTHGRGKQVAPEYETMTSPASHPDSETPFRPRSNAITSDPRKSNHKDSEEAIYVSEEEVEKIRTQLKQNAGPAPAVGNPLYDSINTPQQGRGSNTPQQGSKDHPLSSKTSDEYVEVEAVRQDPKRTLRREETRQEATEWNKLETLARAPVDRAAQTPKEPLYDVASKETAYQQNPAKEWAEFDKQNPDLVGPQASAKPSPIYDQASSSPKPQPIYDHAAAGGPGYESLSPKSQPIYERAAGPVYEQASPSHKPTAEATYDRASPSNSGPGVPESGAGNEPAVPPSLPSRSPKPQERIYDMPPPEFTDAPRDLYEKPVSQKEQLSQGGYEVPQRSDSAYGSRHGSDEIYAELDQVKVSAKGENNPDVHAAKQEKFNKSIGHQQGEDMRRAFEEKKPLNHITQPAPKESGVNRGPVDPVRSMQEPQKTSQVEHMQLEKTQKDLKPTQTHQPQSTAEEPKSASFGPTVQRGMTNPTSILASPVTKGGLSAVMKPGAPIPQGAVPGGGFGAKPGRAGLGEENKDPNTPPPVNMGTHPSIRKGGVLPPNPDPAKALAKGNGNPPLGSETRGNTSPPVPVRKPSTSSLGAQTSSTKKNER